MPRPSPYFQLGLVLLFLGAVVAAVGLFAARGRSPARPAEPTVNSPDSTGNPVLEHPVASAPSYERKILPLGTLISRLRDRDPIVQQDVRAGAAYALGEIGPGNEAVRHAIARALRVEKIQGVRMRLIGTAGAGGSQEAVPDLMHALRDSDPDLRAEAARALGAIGANDSTIVDALIEALDDESSSVQHAADGALGQLNVSRGQAARSRHIDKVQAQRKGEEARSRMPALLEALSSKDAQARRLATSELAGFGEAGSQAAPLLARLTLEDADREVRISAANAIGSMGDASLGVMPTVVAAASASRPETRRRGTLVLNRWATGLAPSTRGGLVS